MQKFYKILTEWLKPFVLAGLLVFGFVLLIGNWFIVSSSSMADTLLQGDLVFVNKLPYGARLWNNRMPGLGQINRNDVVAFNYPNLDSTSKTWQKPIWIKRLVGLPGDTISIKNGIAFSNNIDIDETLENGVKHNYHLKIKGDEASFFYKHKLSENNRISTENDWLVPLTQEQAAMLKTDTQVAYLYSTTSKKNKGNDDVYPFQNEFGWNEDQYGPIVVPKKGMSIRLDLNNISIYRLCIEAYENQELLEFNGRFMLNGQEIKAYTFQQDYYFVLGDNRHNSTDSRYWGFLPKSNLIGRVSHILMSIDRQKENESNKIRWNRTFSAVN